MCNFFHSYIYTSHSTRPKKNGRFLLFLYYSIPFFRKPHTFQVILKNMICPQKNKDSLKSWV